MHKEKLSSLGITEFSCGVHCKMTCGPLSKSENKRSKYLNCDFCSTCVCLSVEWEGYGSWLSPSVFHKQRWDVSLQWVSFSKSLPSSVCWLWRTDNGSFSYTLEVLPSYNQGGLFFFFPIGDTQSLARQLPFFLLDNISKHIGILSIVLREYRIPFFPPWMSMPHFLLTSKTCVNRCSFFNIFFKPNDSKQSCLVLPNNINGNGPLQGVQLKGKNSGTFTIRHCCWAHT